MTTIIVHDVSKRRVVCSCEGRATALSVAAGYLMMGRDVTLRTDGRPAMTLRVVAGQVERATP